MKLLVRRTQSSGRLGNVVFRLWGKVELDDDERAIIKRYGFDGAVLIEAGQEHLLRNSVFVGIVTFALVNMVIFSLSGAKLAMILGLLAGLGAGYFYFNEKRETVFVRDLMHGRNFKCDSVIDLARKEEWLSVITSFLRQVMESAKHWDGTETREIEALSKEDARRVIIQGI